MLINLRMLRDRRLVVGIQLGNPPKAVEFRHGTNLNLVVEFTQLRHQLTPGTQCYSVFNKLVLSLTNRHSQLGLFCFPIGNLSHYYRDDRAKVPFNTTMTTISDPDKHINRSTAEVPCLYSED